MRPFGVWGLFAGLGVRIAAGFGRIYNFGYNRGVVVWLKEGGRLIIGSRQPDRLAMALRQGSASQATIS